MIMMTGDEQRQGGSHEGDEGHRVKGDWAAGGGDTSMRQSGRRRANSKPGFESLRDDPKPATGSD